MVLNEHRLVAADLVEHAEPVGGERAARLDQVDDGVGDAEVDHDLDAAGKFHEVSLHAAFGQPLPRDPWEARGDPFARKLTGFGHGGVIRDAESQPAGADAEVEPVHERRTALGHQVGTGDAEIDRPFGREHRDVVGPQEDHLDRHAAAECEQAPFVAAKGDAGVVEQLRGDFCEASLAGNSDPQQRRFGVIAHEVAPSVRCVVGGDA